MKMPRLHSRKKRKIHTGGAQRYSICIFVSLRERTSFCLSQQRIIFQVR